jgi:uncharacterized protein (DUF1778 family)
MAGKFRAEGPTRPVPIRLSTLERRRLVAAADVNRQTLSAFLRDAGAEAAADCLEDPPGRRHPGRVVRDR